MTTPLRVGVVGGNAERGWAKDAHVGALAALPDFELAAVSARTQDHAERAAAAFGAPRAFGDSLALARDPAIDVVTVAVKVPEHRAVVLAALAARKHVYCEWPLGRDLGEAEEMAAAADRAGSCVMVGLQGVFSPAVRGACDLIASGALGDLVTMRVTSPTAGWGPVAPPSYAYLQDKANGATLATIAGGHTLALIEALAGPYREVEGRSRILRPRVRVVGSDEIIERTCHDHMFVLGEHASGCVSILEVVGGASGDTPFRVELVGQSGSLQLTGGAPGGYQVGQLTLTTSAPGAAVREPCAPSLSGAPANVAEAYCELATAIRAGRPAAPDFHVAARLTRLLSAIERASELGQRQALD